MRKLEVTIVGLTEEDLRRNRVSRRGRAGVALAVILSLLILATSREGIPPTHGIRSNGCHTASAGNGRGEAGDPEEQPPVHQPPTKKPDGEPNGTTKPDNKPNGKTTQPDVDVSKSIVGSPDPLNFPGQPVGSASVELTQTLTNVSKRSIRVARSESSDDAASEFTLIVSCDSSLYLAGSKCNQLVKFHPTVDGNRRAEFRLIDANNQTVGAFSLTGRGISSAARILTGALDFTPPNAQRQPVTIESTGESALTISNVHVEGDGGFSATGGSCRNKPLLRDERCTFDVTYSGHAAPNVQLVSARLIIEHNAPEKRSEVDLQRRVPARANLTADVQMLEFGDVNLAQSGTLNVVVTNSGNAATSSLSVGLTSNGGPFAILQNGCAGSLQPQANCTVSVEFRPNGVATFKNKLLVADPSTLSLVILPVSGSGVRNPIQ